MRLRAAAAKPIVAVVTTSMTFAVGVSSASAQVIVSPNTEPTRNDGGWIYWIAIALTALGVLITLSIVARYLRNASRFQRAEQGSRSVKAPRIQPGRETPRRPVNITGAPVVVPAPVAAAPAPSPVTTAVAVAPAPAAAAPSPAQDPVAAPAPTPTEPSGGGAEGAAAQAAEGAASPGAAEPAAPPAAAESGERKEVALDQETFDRVLAELLEKGTARRVAEGQARRAAMIAARKKAGG